ncbi:hypothetical protein K9M42_00625 [Patescibacteria group bacterium]|nr:hypothetical protein [Patescibacteria group bacterium]
MVIISLYGFLPEDYEKIKKIIKKVIIKLNLLKITRIKYYKGTSELLYSFKKEGFETEYSCIVESCYDDSFCPYIKVSGRIDSETTNIINLLRCNGLNEIDFQKENIGINGFIKGDKK